MPEPTTTSAAAATAASIAILGPLFGDYALIIMASLAGSLWPLSARVTSSPREGGLFIFRMVATASALTGVIAWWLETRWNVPAGKALAPVAFLIAAVGDGWRLVLAAGIRRLGSMLSGRDGGANP